MRSLTELSTAERINFLICNRIPRRYLTLLVARLSSIENPLIMKSCMAIWQLFADDLRLHEAVKSQFSSLHDCFTRELKPGFRPIDARSDVIVSPCDAVIGEHGPVQGMQAFQAKGFPYSLAELFGDDQAAEQYATGSFISLRLKSSMYHRFHAPCDGHVKQVRYISGDTWNVNPVALKVVEKLFCRNERAVIRYYPAAAEDSKPPVHEAPALTLVAVAAILVACIRIHGIPQPLHLRYQGPNLFDCSTQHQKGDEMGWFEHGSTLLLFAPPGYRFCAGVHRGAIIRMGQAIMQRSAQPSVILQSS
ncbi:MAG: archaetidylserine decarboxylase [Xanthomonadales bacterium]|nr:archaetidylserine decarboxylase [Xanthomonadales bacterium]